MKDIDFDELDKAVNSLMGSAGGNSTTAPDEPSPEVSSSTAVEVANDPPAQPVSVTTSRSAVVERPAAPAVRRTGGRFMDMVAKPNDSKPRPGAQLSSREGVAITPPNSQEDTSTRAAVPEPVAAPTTSTDTTESAASIAEPEVTASAPVAEASEAPVEADISSMSTSEPGDSPFISNTKVEKRPLNPGPVSEPTTEVDEPAASSEISYDPLANMETSETAVDDKANVEDSSVDEQLPAEPKSPELASDLVAIESGEVLSGPEASSSVVGTNVAPAVPLGATSIAQQYTTKPSTEDQSHAAIYDSSHYAEPLQHPSKAKSGWLMVLWVILLLAVGAGSAIVLYNLGIIP